MIGRCVKSHKHFFMTEDLCGAAGSNNIVDRPVSEVVLLLESKEKVEKNILESLPLEP